MDTATHDRRRLALAGDGATVDLVVPFGSSVAAALAGARIPFDPSRHALLTRSGREIDPGSAVDDLTDGTLLSVVDLTVLAVKPRRGAGAAPRTDHAELWWGAATGGAALTALGLERLAHHDTLLHSWARPVGATALGLLAAGAAAVWLARRAARGTHATPAGLPFAAIVALSSAAAVIATPATHGGTHLAIALALAAMAAVFSLMAVVTPRREPRGLVGTATTLALVLAAVWGGTLLLGWPIASAAAISLGLVAPGIRLVGTLLLDVHEGYSINYEHFMSQRWTVRGAVPGNPGEVTMDAVQPHVAESTARLTTGVVALTAVAVLTTPLVLPAMHAPSLWVRIGAIGALAATAAALMLGPRHRSSAALRWTPRVGASLIALAVATDLALRADDQTRLLLAGAALLVAVVTAALIIPVSRGASSLVWSRTADLFEWLAVALALPLALLAANVLESVRTMMSS